MDNIEVLDVNELPVIYYEDNPENSITYSGCTFEVDDDKENVNYEPQNKKRKIELQQNSLSKVVNCCDSSITTAGSCYNRSTKYGSTNKKVKIHCSYNDFETEQKKNEKEPEKIKSLNEISQLMLRVQEKTLELNHEELQVRKDTLETQKGFYKN